MAEIVRYRTGIDRETGKVLKGRPHLAQSLAEIWRTRTGRRLMLLDFGSDLRDLLGEDLTQELALDLYREMVTSAHRWEPEARIERLQLVHLTRIGALGVEYGGLYYPHGRFGDYSIVEPLAETFASAARRGIAA